MCLARCGPYFKEDSSDPSSSRPETHDCQSNTAAIIELDSENLWKCVELQVNGWCNWVMAFQKIYNFIYFTYVYLFDGMVFF